MAFIDELRDIMTEVKEDPFNAPGYYARYGVGPAEKQRLMAGGQIPGQPPLYTKSGEEDPEAVRYASQYLAHKRGILPDWLNDVANELAFSDYGRDQTEAMRVKMGGDRGRERGKQDRGFMKSLSSLLWR